MSTRPDPPPSDRGVRADQRRTLQAFPIVDLWKSPSSRSILLWSVASLLFGALVYHWLEGWSLMEALYFCVITLTTIGYGDMSPTTPLAKAFTIFYALNGIAILLALFDRIRALRVPANDLKPGASGPAAEGPGS